MVVNVIHSPKRTDRHELIMRNAASNNLEIKLWDSVHDFEKPRQNIQCAHKQIVRAAKEKGDSETCVAEDDFELLAPDAFQYFLKNKPEDYDLYLSNIIWGRILPDNTVSDSAGLNLYIIHSRYYDRFLESDPNRDLDRAQMRRGIFKVCNPFAAIQAETFSDNMKKVHSNKKLYKNRNLYQWGTIENYLSQSQPETISKLY